MKITIAINETKPAATVWSKPLKPIVMNHFFEKAVRNHLSMGDVRSIIVFHYEIDKGSVKAINDKVAQIKTEQKKGMHDEQQ